MTFKVWLWAVVDWLSLPVMALVAGILVRRKLHRVFPLFFGFLLVSELTGLVRFATAQLGSSRTYLYVYWTSDLVLMIFNFLAVYELFVVRLFPRFYKVTLYSRLFGAASVLVIAGAWASGFASSNSQSWFALESRVLGFVVVAMLLFFVSLMMIMGRDWTRYDFGIAFGFAVNNAAVLITSAVWVRTHYRSSAIDQLPVIAFDLSCLMWLYCFWPKQDPAQQPVSSNSGEMLHQARTWESMLKTWLTPGKK